MLAFKSKVRYYVVTACALQNKGRKMLQNATAQNKQAIFEIMQALLAAYANTFVVQFTSEEDASALLQYTTDLTYNATALQAFMLTGDAITLYNSIMQQDTFVREYFINVLNYIDGDEE